MRFLLLTATVCFSVCLLNSGVTGQSNSCRPGWLQNSFSCYFFYENSVNYLDALALCSKHGAAIVSVNNEAEHNYIVQQLRVMEAHSGKWFTSGVVSEVPATSVEWQGDGTMATPPPAWWYSQEDRSIPYSRVVYRLEDTHQGLSRAPTTDTLHAICEIPVEEAFKIERSERDFTFGNNVNNPNLAPRGPTIIDNPQNQVVWVEPKSSEQPETDGDLDTMTSAGAQIMCLADGFPQPSYVIMKTSFGDNEAQNITSDTDKRYSVTSGSLYIHGPDETLDAGTYQCMAYNKYGAVLSDKATLSFGGLDSFSNVQRETATAKKYQSTVLKCAPPNFKPALGYQWSTLDNFVRTDLNAHMFESSDGNLYFSEVYSTDAREYYCNVHLEPGSDATLNTQQPPGRTSPPIKLNVTNGDASNIDPQIFDGFISSYPTTPRRGDNVRLECLAQGTLPLSYSWRRNDFSMPETARMVDHNRVLEILDVTLEDSGTYVCAVSGKTGVRAEKAHTLVVEAKPYFLLPLPHQHADVDSQLTWRCEARAVPRPSYSWYKNVAQLVPVPGLIEIHRNVIVFKRLSTDHDGMYQCAATNIHGTTYSSAQLRVLAFKPSFLKRPMKSSYTAALGGHVTITCAPEAAPTPSYTWLKNDIAIDVPVDDESRVRQLANGDLYISDVQTTDAGRYTCRTDNNFGHDANSTVLIVVARTVILTAPVNTTARVNTTATMLCKASIPRDRDYIYMWHFNGHPLDTRDHKHIRLGTGLDEGILYIQSAQVYHTGLYTCRVVTRLDEQRESAYLRIQGPPGPPAGVRIPSTTVTATSANIFWYEGDSHLLSIERHTIEARTEVNMTWRVITPVIPVEETRILGSAGRHGYRLENLYPGNTYYFRVNGVNAMGAGKYSHISDMVKVHGSKPTKAPVNVGGGGGSVGTLTITWKPSPLEEQGAPGFGYHVYWRRKDTNTNFKKEVVTGRDTSQFSVTVGQENFYLEYEVKVGAYNSLGDGPVSPDGVYVFSAEGMPIAVVTNVHAGAYNATALWVAWDPITDDRANMKGRLMGYQVNYQLRDVEGASLDAISWRSNRTEEIVIGLDVYTWYYVDVQVLNTAGMGTRGERYAAKTFKHAPLKPPVILNVRPDDGGVYIRFRGVNIGKTEEGLTGYKMEFPQSELPCLVDQICYSDLFQARYWQSTDDIRSARDILLERFANYVTIKGLLKGVVYQCRILGYSRGGEGRSSSAVYFTKEAGQVNIDPSITDPVFGTASRTVPSSSECFTTCFIYLWTIIMFF